ncbi:sensor histidine kinase [Streptomyces sp. NPDC048172]|uniref:sensor histidine kinase n=1 Tax=Streptomyces sp. NPDC048172 TaxID=3365505 RepID=UPI003715602F
MTDISTASTAGSGVWRALARGPRRFLLSSWPWRAFGYLLAGGVFGVGWFFLALGLLSAGLLLFPVGVGVLALLCIPVTAVGLATLERTRLRWIDPRAVPLPDEEEPAPPPGGRRGTRWVRRLWRRAKSPGTWLEFGFALLNAVLAAVDLGVVFVAGFAVLSQPLAMVLVLGGEQVMYGSDIVLTRPAQVLPWLLLTPVFAVLGAYLLASVAGARAALTRAVLVRPRREEELDARLVEVTASRARMADAFEGERRRIERDLHDGAQQRLTGLIMTLGLAKLDADPALVSRAQDEARAVLDELRDLVRGIHPSVLTDRGLGAAIESLAERSTVPVDVDVTGLADRRPPEAAEAAAYFAVAEAFTNIAKHSGAGRAGVRACYEPTPSGDHDLLVVEIRDDGRGGADPAGGSGLTGLADRLAAQDGRLRLSSPAGGPTVVRLELPC